MITASLLGLAFVMGFSIKFSDMVLDHHLKISKPSFWAFTSGLVAAIASTLILVNHPSLMPLMIGVILAVLLTKKLDSIVYFATVGVVLFFAVFYLSPGFLSFWVFFLPAFFDELMSDWADAGRIKNKKLEWFFRQRLLLEIVTLAYVLLTGQWVFISILLFDTGYITCEKIFYNKKLLLKPIRL